MTFSVSLLEFLWVTITLGALIFTATSYVDARSDQAAVTKLNGKARELSASLVATRQALLVLTLVLLLAIALPGLFLADGQSRPPWLSALTIGGLTGVPILLLVLSLIDTRWRKRVIVLLAADALIVKNDALERIESKLDANTAVSTEAASEAKRAYVEANNINERMSAQDAQIVTQGKDAAAATERIEGTLDDTAHKVTDLHEGTAPKLRP